MDKKNILITGVKGFIGSNLFMYLKKKGYKVFGVSKKLEYELKKIKNVDFIIHCAGSGTARLGYKENYKKNYLSTRSVVKFCKKKKKKPTIIFMSSYSIYGFIKSSSAKENDLPMPISSYAKTKKLCEDLLLKHNKSNKINIKILRLSSIYGNGIKKQIFFDACKKISQKQSTFFGTGNEIRDWLHISDLCDFISKILRNPKNRYKIINCGYGKGYKVKHVIKQIKKNLKSNLKIKFIKQKTTEPKKLLININLAKSFNWRPKINLNKGIKKYTNWFKENND